MHASPSDLPPNVQSLIGRAKELFERSFGNDDDDEPAEYPLFCSSAPGRVNLIGEHTDYTGGYVLPLAIGYATVCYGRGDIVKTSPDSATSATRSRIVSSNDIDSVVEFHAGPSSTPSPTNKWSNYVHGVVLQYLPDLQADETFVLDVAIAGDVPLGSGLSSSASLEVATAVFLECILEQHGVAYSSYKYKDNATTLTAKGVKMERATRCQRAENEFCNVPCGIMDQFVSSAGSRGKLLLIDCRTLDFREVSFSGSGEGEARNDDAPVLVVANSNVSHDLGAGEYPVRVRQCRDATDILSKVNPRIESLRDASMEDIRKSSSSSGGLEGILLRRARHVVSENERTLETANALERGDWRAAGRLMNESHESMRDDYEVSCEEIDALVDLARGFDGGDGTGVVYGSRLTGGGFGGCTVTLVRKESARGLIDYLNREYKRRTGKECFCFETSPGDGARPIGV